MVNHSVQVSQIYTEDDNWSLCLVPLFSGSPLTPHLHKQDHHPE